MKTITLSADEDLIEAARKRAESEHTTLDEQIQTWLADYAAGSAREHVHVSEMSSEERTRRAEEALRFLEDMRTRVNTGGRRFSREERNER